MRSLVVLGPVLSLAACQSAYYGAAEKFGIHKRDILVDRVESSRDAQSSAKETFEVALDQLTELINYDGGDLEKIYRDTDRNYNRAESAAKNVRERVKAVKMLRKRCSRNGRRRSRNTPAHHCRPAVSANFMKPENVTRRPLKP